MKHLEAKEPDFDELMYARYKADHIIRAKEENSKTNP